MGNSMPANVFENIDVIHFHLKNVDIRVLRTFPFYALRFAKGVKKLRIRVVETANAAPGEEVCVLDLKIDPNADSRTAKKTWEAFDIQALVDETLASLT